MALQAEDPADMVSALLKVKGSFESEEKWQHMFAVIASNRQAAKDLEGVAGPLKNGMVNS